MNKNTRIGLVLQTLATSLESAARAVQSIREIILEKDSVSGIITIPPKRDSDAPMTAEDYKGIFGVYPPKEGTGVPPSIADYEAKARREAMKTPYTISKVPGESPSTTIKKHIAEKYEKSRLPHTVNALVPGTGVLYKVIIGETPYLKVIGSNKTSIFYKIAAGPDHGAVIVTRIEDGKVTKDGRYNPRGNIYGQLCLCSNDQDGLDYSNIVLRTYIRSRGGKLRNAKLVRYYRPNCGDRLVGQPITHTAVYLKDRYELSNGRPR